MVSSLFKGLSTCCDPSKDTSEEQPAREVKSIQDTQSASVKDSEKALAPKPAAPTAPAMIAKVSPSGCFACDPIIAAGSMKKRLIVCCDGTDNASDKGLESNPTNISRLCRVLSNVGFDETGRKVPQIVYYSSGIGTGEMSKLSSLAQAGFGIGMDEKIAEAYTFLANNYGPEDEIFIFGFSRGAYTARSLAKMICQIGLLTASMMDYFDEIFHVYNTRGKNHFTETAWATSPASVSHDSGLMGLSKSVLDRLKNDLGKENPTNMDYLHRWAHGHTKIKVVGVFDTVGSVGLAGRHRQPGTDIAHYSSTLDAKIEHAFHALALDEQRGNFPATMYWLGQASKDAGTDLRQCWFPGYHSDIGGHADAGSDTNSVDEITFAWMIDQLDGLLQFSSDALQYPLLDRLNKPDVNGPDTPHPKSPEEVHERRVAWSDGFLIDTNSRFYHVASFVSSLGSYASYLRHPGHYFASDSDDLKIDYHDYNETIHPCVWHRMETLGYQPPQLGNGHWTREALGDGQGYEWVKKASLEHNHGEIRLKEYVIPDLVKKDIKDMHNMQHWSGSLERRIVPSDVLKKLDEGNRKLLDSGVAYVH